MAELETDEEKVEAIKKWWKENGVSVIAGIAIGLGGVFGWRAWVDYRDSVAQRASLAFEQLLVATAAGEAQSAGQQAKAIVEQYGTTPYAMLAELAAAKARIEANDPPGAIAALREAVDKAPDPGLAKLAALRLARLLVAEGELQQASGVIDAHDDGGAFSGDFAALRGDIAVAQGDPDTARDAYRAALDAGAGAAQLIELKLQDLSSGHTS